MSSSKNEKTSASSEDEGDQLRRGPWTIEEDNLLHQYIAHNGEGRWNLLAKRSGLKRTGKSCRLRWLNYLKPDVKRGNLSPQEQLLILDLHSKLGNRWSRIAQHLPGRTDNEIKNYWRTRIQRQAKHLKIDVDSTAFQDAIRCFWMPRLLQKAQEPSQPPMFLLPQESTFPRPLHPHVNIQNSPQPQQLQQPPPPPPPLLPPSHFVIQDSDYHEQSSDSDVLAGSCISSSTQASQFSENSTSPFHAVYNNIDSNNYIDNSAINNNYMGSFDLPNVMYQENFAMQNVDGHMGESILIDSDFEDGLWNNNMEESWSLRR